MNSEINFRRQIKILKKHADRLGWNLTSSLFSQIRKGERQLHYINKNEASKFDLKEGPCLQTTISCIYILHQVKDGPMLQLVEAIRINEKGESEQRNIDWISEKALPGENPETTAYRALKEELKFTVYKTDRYAHQADKRLVPLSQHIMPDNTDTNSDRPSKVIANDFVIVLTENEFLDNQITLPNGDNAFGFVEEKRINSRDIRRTYYLWREVD